MKGRLPRKRNVEGSEYEIPEARGKVIKALTIETEIGYRLLSVEFTDGTEVCIDLNPAIQIRVQTLKIDSDGEREPVKTYEPILSIADSPDQ